MSRDSLSQRKFYRDRERAMIGGVCAGIADYFGFHLRTTRILAVVALVVFTGGALILYIGTVLLVPARPARLAGHTEPGTADREFVRAMRSSPKTTIGDVRRRYQRAEARIARLERYVTSPRFNLDQEFKNLQ